MSSNISTQMPVEDHIEHHIYITCYISITWKKKEELDQEIFVEIMTIHNYYENIIIYRR